MKKIMESEVCQFKQKYSGCPWQILSHGCGLIFLIQQRSAFLGQLEQTVLHK